MIYAIDANILVYAYNLDSPFNPIASVFLEEEVLTGNIRACLPYQTLYEFYAYDGSGTSGKTCTT